MTALIKRHQSAFLLFASFMYAQLVILRLGNQAGMAYLPDSLRPTVYIFLQVFVIAGFLTAAFCEKISSPRTTRVLTPAAAGLCLPGGILMLFLPCGSAFYLILTAVTVFCLGLMGSGVYRRLSETSECAHAGLAMGAAYGSAIGAQYLFQLRLEWKIPTLILFLCSFAAIFFILFRAPREDRAKEVPPALLPVRVLIVSCVITLAMLFFTSYYSSYIHHLQTASNYDYSAYTWPRLLMIPSAVAFGAIGDLKKGKYLPLCTLCASILALLNAALTSISGAYFLNMCLYYVALSAVVCYYHLTFWRMASRTRIPALTASAGRILDSVAVIPACLIPFSSFPAVTVLVLNIAALAVIIILMAVSGSFDLSGDKAKALPADRPASPPSDPSSVPSSDPSSDPSSVPSSDPSSDAPDGEGGLPDPLVVIRERYALTPAEVNVFRELVQTEDKQIAIAERLSVKTRTVQAYVTSIYRKTGISTRAGLVLLYHDVLRR